MISSKELPEDSESESPSSILGRERKKRRDGGIRSVGGFGIISYRFNYENMEDGGFGRLFVILYRLFYYIFFL